MAADEPLNPEEELAALQTLLGEALLAYGDMLRRDRWDEAEVWLERLAEYWRIAAEINRLEERGEELLSPDAVELMAALESSLTLAGSDEEDEVALMLDDTEFTPRLLAVGAERMWADWDEVLDESWREGLRVLGRPDSDRPPDWPPPQPPLKRPRRSDKRVMRPLLAELDERTMAGAEIYQRLHPDGRALSAEERAAARDHLRLLAAFNRRMDIASPAFARTDWEPTVMVLSDLRSVGRNIVLALSENPQRRRLAMGEGESRVRTWVLKERIAGASWEEAYARVRAIAQAASAEAEGAGSG